MDYPILIEKQSLSTLELSTERKFKAVVSAAVVDHQGELVDLDALEEQLKNWIERRHGTIIDRHSNRPCGEAYAYHRDKFLGTDCLIIEARIFQDHKNDDRVWSDIQNGVLGMMSIGGEVTAGGKTCNEYECYFHIKDLDLSEISVVEGGANPLAFIIEKSRKLGKKIQELRQMSKQDIEHPIPEIEKSAQIMKMCPCDGNINYTGEHIEGCPYTEQETAEEKVPSIPTEELDNRVKLNEQGTEEIKNNDTEEEIETDKNEIVDELNKQEVVKSDCKCQEVDKQISELHTEMQVVKEDNYAMVKELSEKMDKLTEALTKMVNLKPVEPYPSPQPSKQTVPHKTISPKAYTPPLGKTTPRPTVSKTTGKQEPQQTLENETEPAFPFTFETIKKAVESKDQDKINDLLLRAKQFSG